MRTVFKTTNVSLSANQSASIEKRFTGLERFLKSVVSESGEKKGKSLVQLAVEIGKPSRHHRTGKVYYAEATLFLPGKRLRAEAWNDDLLFAAAEAKDELQRQIKHYKQKMRAKAERRQRKLKRDIRLSSSAK